MKIFRALKNLVKNLTKEKNQVSYESIQEPQEPEIIEQPPIEEKTTLDTTKIENPCVNQVRDWAINKIDLLHEADRHRNAKALAAEFDEWINIPDGTDELDYLCIENEDWTDEQEIDIR